MPLQSLIFSPPHLLTIHFNNSASPVVAAAPTNNTIKSPRPVTFLASSIRTVSVFASLSNAPRSEQKVTKENLVELKRKVEDLGINCSSCTPGVYSYSLCPKCHGGPSLERSLSFYIIQSGENAIWRCFRFECGWAGQISADDRAVIGRVNQQEKISFASYLSKGTLRLEPLGDELIAYFEERMISKATLQKNHVMQLVGDRNVIAFPYRRDGTFVGCKYRSVDKRFWKEKGAENIFYGVDDVKDADEIIIVEGEVDKLSMDEVGLSNCISVPDGAPQTVSDEEFPSLEKDTRFQYLWNGKEYLDKASRIILATDGDIPGQVLAEELARRLGRERCWQVRWPKKDEGSFYKDANEVLKNLGADALRELVKNAEFYRTHNSN